MKTRTWMLWASLAIIPAARAADNHPVREQVEACKQQQRAEGERMQAKTAIKCAVKAIFQSRIRRKKDEEPVEMTVGSPPMVTDDTDTPGDRNWEINLGLHGEFAGGERRIEAPSIDVNYGIGERVQVAYGVPYAFVRAPDDVTGVSREAGGFGDSVFGLKYRFFDDKDHGLSFAIYPQLEFRTPGANRAVSETGTGFILPILMTREFEHASIGANAGVEISGGQQNWFASLGVGTRITSRTALLAEIAGTDLNSPEASHVLLNVGLRHKISEKQSISGSLGRDVRTGSGEGKQTYLAVVYQWAVGE